MSGSASAGASSGFSTKAINFIRSRKSSDFFFAGVAMFALSIVVRQELMRKGMIQAPVREDQITPKIERKRRKKKSEDDE